jgi:ubiquinone/menaquinone biosynthesis C-methylase UbiE
MYTGKQPMLTVDFGYLQMRPGVCVLDAGCGTGRHIREALRSQGVYTIGIDRNWEDLCIVRNSFDANQNGTGSSCALSMADITNLPFCDSTFDIVFCSEVLEHIEENEKAIRELIRVLKPGKDMVVSVPAYLPERICWAISGEYHLEPGGHVRIYKKKTLKSLLERCGAKCWKVRYKHAFHVPYWWLKCIVGHKNEKSRMVNAYKRFLEWDIMTHPVWMRRLDKLLNPVMGKSIVFYLKKGC